MNTPTGLILLIVIGITLGCYLTTLVFIIYTEIKEGKKK